MLDSLPTYKGTGVYILVERIYPRDSITNWNGIGSTTVQVHKMVYELYQRQNVYLDGEVITPTTISLWQNIKILFGAKLVLENSTNESFEFVLVYSGSKFIMTLIDGISSRYIPGFLKKAWRLPTERILSYGVDPIPGISIYGHKAAEFIVRDGGKGTPEAAAKYDVNTNQLIMVHSEKELPDLMRILKCVRNK